jgi:hypothetical protein
MKASMRAEGTSDKSRALVPPNKLQKGVDGEITCT